MFNYSIIIYFFHSIKHQIHFYFERLTNHLCKVYTRVSILHLEPRKAVIKYLTLKLKSYFTLHRIILFSFFHIET